MLPFLDDIRYPELDSKIVGDSFHYANEDQIRKASALVEATTLEEDFATTDISNPHLQRHFQIIEVTIRVIVSEISLKSMLFRLLLWKKTFLTSQTSWMKLFPV